MLIKSGSELNEFCIDIDSSITDAMFQIEKNCKRGALVINKQNEVVGVITDGDIRRSLIRGVLPNTLIKDVLNSNFKFIENQPNNDLQDRLTKVFNKYNELEIVPVVNQSMKLISLGIRRSWCTLNQIKLQES